MSDSFDIYTLLFLVLAVVIFLRLRNVLGRRTGNERQPYDPYSAQDAGTGAKSTAQDTVVPLPRSRGSQRPGDISDDLEERVGGYAPKGSPLAGGLADIGQVDRSFAPEQFLRGAKAAYEMIVMAFAEGNKRALRQLLSRDVYDGFVSAIVERENRSESVETSFVGIDKADIIEAELKNKMAQVTVKFVSELITATRDQEGRIIDGDPKKVREVTDIWTFSREAASKDPNWKLVATEAAN
ncbi:MAG: Tim44/TimA family putative adaptor protein [Methyloligellaceae bacterium]